MPILKTSAERGKQVVGMYKPSTWREKGLPWTLGLFAATYVVVVIGLGIYWSKEPNTFDVVENSKEISAQLQSKIVTGTVTTDALITVANTMLDKPGGYLSNDVTPPGVYLDNMPNWEFGVLTQVRDMARAFRNDFSRSQSQSAEDKDIIVAEPRFNFDSSSWMFPSTESEYREAIHAMERYAQRLADPQQTNAQFYARADNLNDWLGLVDKRLGSLSQRLSMSVGQDVVHLGVAGDKEAQQSTPVPAQSREKTPWTQIDDVFYEARGQAWALLHFLKAVQVDFAPILANKNAQASLQQIINELESTQQMIWSPIILNGNGFGFVTNHSLIMASYLSRANAALIDLRRLLAVG
jgi:hypothetical protein